MFGTVYLYFYMGKEEEAVAYLQEIVDKFTPNSEIEKLYKRYVKPTEKIYK